MKNGQAFPCGRCLPCLFNRRRIWTHRIMLEAAQYSDNSFVTLTYSDEHLPRCKAGTTFSQVTDQSTPALATLSAAHVQNFMKRLRKRIAPTKIRFYLCGEYGDESERPHYHAALFNFPTCYRGHTGLGMVRPDFSRCCERCALVGETWGYGKVYLGILEAASAQYVAGYVTKKMTSRDDMRLKGREPEFSRMSNRPGIGLSAMWELADALMKHELDETLVDVPVALRHGSRELPLGRYLRRKLRTMIGREENTPDEVIEALKAELSPLRQAAFDASKSFKKAILEDSAQAVRNFKARQRLFNTRKTRL